MTDLNAPLLDGPGQSQREESVDDSPPGGRPTSFPQDALDRLREDMEAAGPPYDPPEFREGQLGVTMFDTPTSEDNTIPVLAPRSSLASLPSQSTVRIKSADGRVYLGVVVKGPFALPDGLRADAPPVVATAIRGGFFLPEYHGLVIVEIMGEEKAPGRTQPHRFRPLPNSPVFALSQEEVRELLKTGGDVRLGRAYGHDDLEIAFSAHSKDALPRHMAVLGTTGGGKSTTVAGMVARLQAAGVAVILLDTEGEYTAIDQPAESASMLEALADAGLSPAGVPDTTLHYLVGRDCANPFHPRAQPFSPRFSGISPYAAVEILDLNDAQQERFQKALEVTTRALDQLDIWDDVDRKWVLEDLDEFDEGYPRMTLTQLYDVVRATAEKLQNASKGQSSAAEAPLKTPQFRSRKEDFLNLIDTDLKFPASWRVLQGRIGKIERLNLFDNPKAPPLDFAKMIRPGGVSIIDLSDTDSTLVNNLVISDLLRGVQKAQEAAYQTAVDMGKDPTPVVIVIEEAHEFLSAQRLGKMPTLHQQVERIAKRGRKRRLGLVFVTQLPQHLPDAILGLVNNFILHKIGDANVIARLKRSVGNVDEALWNRIPRLAPGQAIVSMSTLTRPMLTVIDPAPCRLRLIQ